MVLIRDCPVTCVSEENKGVCLRKENQVPKNFCVFVEYSRILAVGSSERSCTVDIPDTNRAKNLFLGTGYVVDSVHDMVICARIGELNDER